jgi:hypothetical protein
MEYQSAQPIFQRIFTAHVAHLNLSNCFEWFLYLQLLTTVFETLPALQHTALALRLLFVIAKYTTDKMRKLVDGVHAHLITKFFSWLPSAADMAGAGEGASKGSSSSAPTSPGASSPAMTAITSHNWMHLCHF